jgi:hypothetical protein
VKTAQPTLSGEQLARCLAYLQAIVPSLEQLGTESTHESRARYAEDLAQFVETWGVMPKLQEVRSLLLQLASEEQLKSLEGPAVWHKDQSPAAARPKKRRSRTH